MINTNYLAWKKKALPEHNWKDGKKWFSSALNDVEDINKLTTGEAGLTLNVAIKQQYSEHKFREEMAEKLGESFVNLEMAAMVKNKTIYSIAQSISKITSANSKLTVTFKKLTAQLETELKQNRSRNNNNNNNKDRYNQNNNNNLQKWPSWCDPDVYCSTCG